MSSQFSITVGEMYSSEGQPCKVSYHNVDKFGLCGNTCELDINRVQIFSELNLFMAFTLAISLCTALMLIIHFVACSDVIVAT